jgi:hypothetical protein
VSFSGTAGVAVSAEAGAVSSAVAGVVWSVAVTVDFSEVVAGASCEAWSFGSAAWLVTSVGEVAASAVGLGACATSWPAVSWEGCASVAGVPAACTPAPSADSALTV